MFFLDISDTRKKKLWWERLFHRFIFIWSYKCRGVDVNDVTWTCSYPPQPTWFLHISSRFALESAFGLTWFKVKYSGHRREERSNFSLSKLSTVEDWYIYSSLHGWPWRFTLTICYAENTWSTDIINVLTCACTRKSSVQATFLKFILEKKKNKIFLYFLFQRFNKRKVTS